MMEFYYCKCFGAMNALLLKLAEDKTLSKGQKQALIWEHFLQLLPEGNNRTALSLCKIQWIYINQGLIAFFPEVEEIQSESRKQLLMVALVADDLDKDYVDGVLYEMITGEPYRGVNNTPLDVTIFRTILT
jgi:hypothetical protein